MPNVRLVVAEDISTGLDVIGRELRKQIEF